MYITPTRETVVSLLRGEHGKHRDRPSDTCIDEPNRTKAKRRAVPACAISFSAGPELKPQPDTLGRLVLHVCTATQLIRGTGVPSHCWDYPNAASSKCPARC